MYYHTFGAGNMGIMSVRTHPIQLSSLYHDVPEMSDTDMTHDTDMKVMTVLAVYMYNGTGHPCLGQNLLA